MSQQSPGLGKNECDWVCESWNAETASIIQNCFKKALLFGGKKTMEILTLLK